MSKSIYVKGGDESDRPSFITVTDTDHSMWYDATPMAWPSGLNAVVMAWSSCMQNGVGFCQVFSLKRRPFSLSAI